MTVHAVTYAEACRDPNLFGPWFEGETWATWRVVDKALFGEPLTAAELSIFRELTGRDEAPTKPAEEAWFVCGRRSGKDVKAASIAIYLATFGAEVYGYRQRLTRGERGVVQALAVDRDQARVVMGYAKAMLEQPIFAQMVTKPTADSVELANGLALEVATNDQRRVRGRTVVAAVFDEVAFWRSENSVNPDDEVYAAVKPSMVTIPGALLIGISSPYARKGLLWKKHKRHFGKPGNVLIIQAPTWRMNPTIARDGEFLTDRFAEDPASAAAEFGAEFRGDIEGFVMREVVEACVTLGAYERAPLSGVQYSAFIDPSGGSGKDSFTLAIGHSETGGEKRRPVLDAVRETKPPMSPEAVVAEYAKLLKSYRVTKIVGDRYAGEWPREAFRKHNITYEPSAKPKSDLYRDLLPLLNSGDADLLDNERLVSQLVGLERRTSRGGRDSIDHAPNAHDDVANAVAGVLTTLKANGSGYTLDNLG
ncbi:hypothetical protein [Aureimonas leprariae]|uniref:Terminase n=1 Tax=Plantimonas leprariae TaxID=2615207 RepID=A0A7V7PL17_9HYPH|nr:hypothetical protein [Aureimonas leprariae]KAB0676707.1 hypothetical protein F6X38_20620 [Aureimonas leprariae]